jgi:hypothetical protein
MVLMALALLLRITIKYLPLERLFGFLGHYATYWMLIKDQLSSPIGPVGYMKILLLLAMLWRGKWDGLLATKTYPYFFLYALSVCMTLAFGNSWVVLRVTEYFLAAELIAIPCFITSLPERRERQFWIFVVVCFFFAFFVRVAFFASPTEKLTYKTIFEN